MDYLNGGRWSLVAEFTEIESGKRNDRPELAKALATCKKQKAKLVIAKLDRLSRNLAFIATLMDSGVEFVAVDNPHANKLTVHILAAVAQHEREIISARTSARPQGCQGAGQATGKPQAIRGSASRGGGQEGEGRPLLGQRAPGDPGNSSQRGQVASRGGTGIGSTRYCDGARWRMDAGASKRDPPACEVKFGRKAANLLMASYIHSDQKKPAPVWPTVSTISARSRKRFLASQLVSATKRQPWHAAPCSVRSSSAVAGSWSAHTGSPEQRRCPFQSGLENSDKPPCDLDETAQRALIAGAGGVDQDPALNWLPWHTREHVEALFQCAGRISAIDRDLGHEGMRETVCHHIFGPLAFAEAVLAHQYAPGTLGVDPRSRSRLELSCTRQNTGLRTANEPMLQVRIAGKSPRRTAPLPEANPASEQAEHR